MLVRDTIDRSPRRTSGRNYDSVAGAMIATCNFGSENPSRLSKYNTGAKVSPSQRGHDTLASGRMSPSMDSYSKYSQLGMKSRNKNRSQIDNQRELYSGATLMNWRQRLNKSHLTPAQREAQMAMVIYGQNN